MSSPSEVDLDRIVRRLDALLLIVGGATLTLIVDVFGTNLAFLLVATLVLLLFALRGGRSEG